MSAIAAVSLNSAVDTALEVAGFEVGAHVKALRLHQNPAGKGVNVARVLDALDVPTRLYGFIGEDMAAWFDGAFAGSRIDNRMIALPMRTRGNITILDPLRGTETHLRESGDRIEPESLARLESQLRDELAPGDHVVFSGSLPTGILPEQFGEMLNRLAGRGYQMVVDSSGEALIVAARSGAHLINPNFEELAMLIGDSGLTADHIASAAERLADQFPGLQVLASHGEEGAWLISREEIWHARADTPVEVKSTIGAGDALLAGYLWGVADSCPAREALSRAVRVATASVATLETGQIDKSFLQTPIRITGGARQHAEA